MATVTTKSTRQEEVRFSGLRLQQHPGPRGRRARPAPPGDVHRHHQFPRPASPGDRGRRQLRRRGDGGPRDQDHRHAPRRRQRVRAGRRRRHPRQADPAREGPSSRRRGRAHDAERRREVRRRRLLDLRRPARRGRLGRERPLREDDGRHPARRLRVASGVRAGAVDHQADEGQGQHEARHHDPLLAGPRDLHRDDGVQARAADRAAPRARVPERGPRDPSDRRARGPRPQGRLPLQRRPQGLREVPERQQGGRPQADRDRAEGRRRGRGRDAVEHRLHGVRVLVRQHDQHARGRHARRGAQEVPDQRDQPLRARQGPGQGEGGEPDRRGRPRGPHRHHLREAPRPAVRGTDEDEARQRVDALARRDHDERAVRHVDGGASGRREADRGEGHRGGQGADGGAAGARPHPPQVVPGIRARCPASSRTVS